MSTLTRYLALIRAQSVHCRRYSWQRVKVDS